MRHSKAEHECYKMPPKYIFFNEEDNLGLEKIALMKMQWITHLRLINHQDGLGAGL